jgi:hypothetical protein
MRTLQLSAQDTALKIYLQIPLLAGIPLRKLQGTPLEELIVKAWPGF